MMTWDTSNPVFLITDDKMDDEEFFSTKLKVLAEQKQQKNT